MSELKKNKKRLRSPLSWFGGKSLLAPKMAALAPPHRIYAEGWGGSAALLFAKEPSPVEVYNDLNSGLVGLFRVLRDPERFEEFYRLCSLTPFAREEFEYWRENWAISDCPIQRAYGFYIVACWSFAGLFGSSFSYGLSSSARGLASSVSRWLGRIERLPEIAARLLRLQVEKLHAFDFLVKYDTPDTFHYCDPPYVPSTRRNGKYEHEMSECDHAELVALLLSLKGKVLLSGYDTPVYAPLERAGWERREFDVVCQAVGRTRVSGVLGKGACAGHRRTEVLWANYALPSAS